MHRLQMVGIFRCFGIERNHADLPAALLRSRLVPMIGQKITQRRQEKRAELAFFPAHLSKPVMIEQMREERLRQVLGIVRTVALSPDERVKRIPVPPSNWKAKNAK